MRSATAFNSFVDGIEASFTSAPTLSLANLPELRLDPAGRHRHDDGLHSADLLTG
jgi:hypothetical protein